MRAPNTTNGFNDRVALYPRCIPSASIDCAGTQGSSSVLPGYRDSFNPNNLNPFDYYNNPNSPGSTRTPNPRHGGDNPAQGGDKPNGGSGHDASTEHGVSGQRSGHRGIDTGELGQKP